MVWVEFGDMCFSPSKKVDTRNTNGFGIHYTVCFWSNDIHDTRIDIDCGHLLAWDGGAECIVLYVCV